MPPMTHVHFLWFRLGQSLPDAAPAETLVDDMADLTTYFRDLLRQHPDRFDCTAELQGFAPMRLTFRSLGQTVALVAFQPHTDKDKLPDALCLLVNGLEGPDDIAAVKASVAFPPEVWRLLDASEKPVVAAVFNVNGRVRDPATTTVLHVLANVFFNQFGTNAVGGESGPS